MATQLTALSSPPRAPGALDHVQGLAVAVVATCAGAILTPFLALAWVAAQPVLLLGLALRAASPGRAGATAPATADRAAA